MNISTFISENKAKLKLTKKLNVRDLDELEKNTFVAYVDEGKNSFDVQIVLDNKKNIKNSQCDCEQGGICIHIVALAVFISNQKTEKTVIKKPLKRKLSETDILLETVDNERLRIWVSELISKNKEIAFLFKNTFDKKNIVLDKEFIKNTIKECISSVVGKRKTIETNEVKKIVDALNISFQPLYDHIYISPITSSKYKLISILTTLMEEIHYDYYISSIKITRLEESIYDNLLKSHFGIKDFEVWKECTSFYFSLLFNKKIMLKDFNFCKKIYDFSETNEIQRQMIANFIEKNINEIYAQNKLDYFTFNIDFEQFFFKVYVDNNLFKIHYLKFRPRKYQNEYNLDLIKELYKINQFELVEKYCSEQINGNVNGKYDMPYVEILVDLYKTTKENKKLANLLSIYGKYIFEIETYLFIKENCPHDHYKKYHNVVLVNARNSYQNGDSKAFEFYYEVKKLNGKSADIIEMLRNCRHFYFIEKYKEIAIKIDEIKFIQIVLNASLRYNESSEKIESVANFICNYVDKNKLKFYLRNIPYYSQNKIFHLIEKNLEK